MKAVTFNNILEYKDVDDPHIIQSNEVKIKVKSVGLCGSDIHKILGKEIPQNYLKTDILGHEVSGIITEKGTKVSNLNISDRVCVEPIFPISYINNYQFSNDTKFLGRDVHGAFSEYIVVPDKAVFKIPESLSFDSACFTDVIAVALHGINQCVQGVNNKIAIIGDGSIALATLVLCLILGVSNHIICIGCSEDKLKIAQSMGATDIFLNDNVSDKLDSSYDVVFEAVGGSQAKTLTQAISLCKPQGTIGVFGVFSPNYLHNIYLRSAFYKELSIKGLNSYSIYDGKREFEEALNILKEHHKRFDAILTHKFPLASFIDILDTIKNKKKNTFIKIIFHP